MTPVVIAVDAGTTGIRAISFDRHGHVLDLEYRELTQRYPQPGWVEHDAAEIWACVKTVLGEVCARVDGEIAAIGITNQRETTVVWDRATRRPLHPAIVWQDRRTAARCEQLAVDGHLPLVRETTGLVLDAYFSATKLAWILDQDEVHAGPDTAFGTVDSWVLCNLTGGEVHATDVTNASRTMLLDIGTGAWSPALCDLLEIPRHVLPDVRPSSVRFGVTAGGGGIPAGIPISGIAGDQQASLFGQACFDPGMTKNTYGTGSFVLMNVGTDRPAPVDGLLTTIAWGLPSPDGGAMEITYAYEGAIFVTGAAVQWLRDELGIIEASKEVGPLASSVDDTDGVVVVPAFAGLGSPWWDPHARGTVVGITRGTGRAHIARAVIEAMAFQTRDVVEAMARSSGRAVRALRADGGASAMPLLLQLQADQLQVPVSRPVVQDTTALGAAYLAGLAEGVWSSLVDIADNWELDVEVPPAVPPGETDAGYRRWLTAVDRSRNWATD